VQACSQSSALTSTTIAAAPGVVRTLLATVLSIELLTKHDVAESSLDADIKLVIMQIEAGAPRRGFNNVIPSTPTPRRGIKRENCFAAALISADEFLLERPLQTQTDVVPVSSFLQGLSLQDI
jgi:hypothetical protein